MHAHEYTVFALVYLEAQIIWWQTKMSSPAHVGVTSSRFLQRY